ncbi:NF-kappa-B inhibitor-interacting Ras-like protein 2 [Ischnura elegans]|uniref:NF-kappa-B inhibitor-interacting Ras-like protein 2 n=1 Tax=Ischnura elegans TaxID=197161 RepID=UPI001ED89CB9|nr:NF-kappa-B inhibitor-interacting Ras-like protein 2 [Ischnura elegans]
MLHLGSSPVALLARKRYAKYNMGKTPKVVVCGMKGVGKTSILEQLIYGKFSKDVEIYPTIEDIYVAHVETDRGTKEKLRFYDTAGLVSAQSEFPRQYLTFADGFVLVYDPSKSDSIEIVLSLKKDIDKHREKKEVAVVILAHKIGGKQEKVDISKLSNCLAREKVKLFEVDALDRTSLFEPFVYLASKINPPTNKSTFPQLSMVRKAKDS